MLMLLIPLKILSLNHFQNISNDLNKNYKLNYDGSVKYQDDGLGFILRDDIDNHLFVGCRWLDRKSIPFCETVAINY